MASKARLHLGTAATCTRCRCWCCVGVVDVVAIILLALSWWPSLSLCQHCVVIGGGDPLPPALIVGVSVVSVVNVVTIVLLASSLRSSSSCRCCLVIGGGDLLPPARLMPGMVLLSHSGVVVKENSHVAKDGGGSHRLTWQGSGSDERGDVGGDDGDVGEYCGLVDKYPGNTWASMQEGREKKRKREIGQTFARNEGAWPSHNHAEGHKVAWSYKLKWNQVTKPDDSHPNLWELTNDQITLKMRRNGVQWTLSCWMWGGNEWPHLETAPKMEAWAMGRLSGLPKLKPEPWGHSSAQPGPASEVPA
ncbi:hypothetical protein EDB85DRAFT_1896603 [Lactarius pseudohatsudake]|nr:hypothetical protein EDB85DRAFT_1896603 [Lactarius pseudohatsudake]